MKSINNITGIVVIICCLLSITTTAQELAAEESELIVGTWVVEDSPNVQLVFTSDGFEKDYIDGVLEDTYTWEIIEGNTPSGLTITHLILTNILDATDIYNFEIMGIDEEVLALVYQRPGPGGGIGKLAFYYRQ